MEQMGAFVSSLIGKHLPYQNLIEDKGLDSKARAYGDGSA